MRLLMSISILLLLASSTVFTALAADPPSTGTVTGMVQTADGQPATDCIVTLQQAAQKMRVPLSTTTDAQGKFTIEKAPEGDYNLNVRTTDGKARAIKTMSVTAGQTTDVGTLKLKMSR
jgi:hypothetical protein